MSNSINIAIADDHALFRKSLSVLIELFPGYKVTCDAANGKDLISQISARNIPDIVLMDIHMPIMDGYQATAWLREHYPDVHVLALSTMDAESAIIKMIKSGAKGYVLKDADPEELRLAFQDLLHKGYFYNDLITRKIVQSVVDLTEKDNDATLFARLSQREVEFLKYACTELTYKEIADAMKVGVRTVEGYRDTLCDKLNLKTRVGLVMYAVKNNLVKA